MPEELSRFNDDAADRLRTETTAVVRAEEAQTERVQGKLERMGRRLENQVHVYGACFLVGGAYGAVFGSLCGSEWWNGEGPLTAVSSGALIGGGLGAVGGIVSAAVGTAIGGRVGWCLAGVLGSVVPAACMWMMAAAVGFAERSRAEWAVGFSRLAWAPVLMGGFLGVALAMALRSGRSAVPGVQHLVTIINAAQSSVPSAISSRTPAEVSPAGPPEGRGDETTPASPV